MVIDWSWIAFVLICVGVGAGLGAGSLSLKKWIHSLGDFFIIKVYQDLGDKKQEVARFEEKRTKQTKVAGGCQFILDPEAVIFYEQGHPVLEFDVDLSLPMVTTQGSRMITKAEFVGSLNGGKPFKSSSSVGDFFTKSKVVRDRKDKETANRPELMTLRPNPTPRYNQIKDSSHPNPSSRIMKRYVKDHFIQQLAAATKGFDLKAFIPLAIIMLVMGVALGYVIVSMYHPGMVQAPPAGYRYLIQLIPSNATTTTTSSITTVGPSP